ncbi:Transposon-encoded protein with TYA [Rasamsonia emersonii CBS 393.64]|uniref:Transposon-encoded protein with TYA n=1 Tax=Rasamsonia emersonii (strain ATCC 16479 / CBS 393.64 / IMI 116815) TaxID=1408163 RepID=A0A0F4YVL0_RASE3|nr:Transposon-encoded protein with TYA [Rasamsonia emersonii CBS 393.64]KKA21648.1 Transposon-encoded protein with TYA [Rasamsonia emersonii CBS 393.64]
MARLSRPSLIQTAEDHFDELDEEVTAFMEEVENTEDLDISVKDYNGMIKELLTTGSTELRKLVAGLIMENRNEHTAYLEKEAECISLEKQFHTELAEAKEQILETERTNRLLHAELRRSEAEFKQLQEASRGTSAAPSSVTTEYKVAYVMKGFDEKPDKWAQQYYRHDPEGVLKSWKLFKAAINKHFEDPDRIANQQEKLLSLQHNSSDDLLDHITEFETLCSQVDWPESTKATLFLKSLQPGLRGAIRRSDINIEDYDKVKQKGLRLEREYKESKKQHSAARKGDRKTSSKPKDTKPADGSEDIRSEHLRKGLCFNCNEPGHISRDCNKPKKDTKANPATKSVAAVELPSENESLSTESEAESHDLEFLKLNRFNGLLDDLRTKLGITDNTSVSPEEPRDIKSPTKDSGDDDPNGRIEKNDDPIGRIDDNDLKDPAKDSDRDEEEQQDAINAAIRAAGITVTRMWTPFHYKGRYEPKIPKRFEDWRIQVAAAFEEDQMSKHPFPQRLIDGDVELPEIYEEFRDIFEPSRMNQPLPYRPEFAHAINLKPGLSPPSLRQYHQSELELQITKEKTDELMRRGFIRRSQSSAGAPTLFAAKKGAPDPRMCCDYRILNGMTEKDRYPLPLIDVLLDRVRKAKYFVKLDLRDGFHHIRIRKGDEWKTAFKTRYGLFEWLVMPFGLCNAPATFQRYIDQALHGLIDEELIAYLDDILIYGSTLEEVQERTRHCLQRLREWGLCVKLRKCRFHVQTVNFLGFQISPEGISMEEDLIQTIQKWPVPKRVRDVQAFIGTAGFYRRFVPRFSHIAKPLTDLTRKGRQFDWGPKEQAAFERLKAEFVPGRILMHFDPDRQIYVYTDASNDAASAILCQKDDNERMRPVMIWSKKFSTSERKYSTPDQELLAIVWGMERFRPYVEGARYTVIVRSDHANLRNFMTTKDLKPLQVRWAERLSRFDFVIEHIQGHLNPADGPSRRPDYVIEDEFPEEPKAFLKFASASLRFEQSPEPNQVEIAALALSPDMEERIKEKLVTDETATEIYKDPPQGWEARNGLLFYHDRFYVPKDCQQNKANTHLTFGRLEPLPPPEKPWSRIGIDLITDLPRTKYGHDCIQVHVDHFSKGIILASTRKTAGAKEAAILTRKNVISKKGIPRSWIMDRDKRWLNSFWSQLGNDLRMEFNPSTAYHPQSDGQTERMNEVIEAYLRAFTNYLQDDWDEWLDMAEMAWCNSKHSALGVSPFFAEHGYDPDVEFVPEHPGRKITDIDAAIYADFMKELHEILRENLQRAQETNKKYYDRKRADMVFEVGDQVYLRTTNIRSQRPCKKLDRKKEGPFTIKRAINKNAYELDLPPQFKVHPVFHIELLEPYHPPVPGQEENEEPEDLTRPTYVDGRKEYTVRAITDAVRDENDQIRFRVRWEGCDEEEDTWEPFWHLTNCPERLDEFIRTHPDCPALPVRPDDMKPKSNRRSTRRVR